MNRIIKIDEKNMYADVEPYVVGATLQAAREVFLCHGYRKATVEDIGRAEGVTRPTVYAHFGNKKALLVSLVELEGRRVVEAGLEGAGRDRNAVERLVSMFVAVEKFVKEDNFLKGIVSRDPEILTPEVIRIALGFEERIIDALADILEEGMEEGTIRKADPYLMAYVIARLHEMFMFSPLSGLDRYDPDRIDGFLVDVVISILSPQAPGP